MPSNYEPNVPTGLVGLDRDYRNLQKNFSQANTTFGTDHTTVDDQTSNNGYHKVVRLIPQSTPAAISGIGSLYSNSNNDGYAADASLFFNTGTIAQSVRLSSNFLPVAGTNGYTFLPGGIVMQWGKYTAPVRNNTPVWPSGDQTILFKTSNINFSTEVLTLTFTFNGPAGTSFGEISAVSVDEKQFIWRFNGVSGVQYTGFYWVALGR